MSSMAQEYGRAYVALYSAPKTFLTYLSEALWVEFGQYGVDTLSNPETVFDTKMRLLVGVLNQSDVGAQPFGVPTTN